MNRFLAAVLAKLNTAVAVFLIVVGAVGGTVREGVPGLFYGTLGGGLIVIVVCGALAVILDMRAALREIALTLKKQTQ